MATYTKSKLFTLPEYKQSKGDRQQRNLQEGGGMDATQT